jgi:tetratricopeptide (TPR) repeat protein
MHCSIYPLPGLGGKRDLGGRKETVIGFDPHFPVEITACKDECPAPRREARTRSWRIRVVSLVCLYLLAISSPAHAQSPTDYYLTRSDKTAASVLGQVEKYHLDPAASNLRAGQYQYSYDELSFILRYFPNHPQALVLLSELCAKWKQPARCDADARFQRAVQVNPEAADTYTIHGMYLQNTGRVDQAIESYKRALALNPVSMNAHYNLGLAYVNKKNFEEANQHAQQAYALGMTLPGLRNMLTKAGAWKPLPAQSATAPAAGNAPADAPSEGGPAAK